MTSIGGAMGYSQEDMNWSSEIDKVLKLIAAPYLEI